MKYLDIFIQSYKNYANYLWHEITHPGWHNYFYWLIGVSLFFFLLEVVRPWRKDQPRFRKDFWLDFFYMFFNFFLFSLIIYNAASDVVVNLFHDLLGMVGITNLVALEVQSWPVWAHLLLGFVVRDFVQWWVHRLLHRSPVLWEFHKVHHSVEQMGFAAHLRYHWMENVVYRSIEYLPLALIGIGLNDFFIIHIFTLAVGHFNHSNITVSGRVKGAVLGALIGLALAAYNTQSWWGVQPGTLAYWAAFSAIVLISTVLTALILGPYMKYIFNSPEMHIWHHAYELPPERRYGVNFGLTLALWDYLFGTDYIPYEGRDIRLGFPGVEQFPHTFIGQNLHGFGKKDRH
ncbi:MAG: fatty acid hydroxylase family protein [Bacteroidetes bacterium]|nr:MAG: fatty acid hydroxylase family protein [Bacteroidota bacterium]